MDSDTEDFSEEEVSLEMECLDLFSDKKFGSARECLQACKDIYGFDIEVLRSRLGMDTFSCLKLINYIRTNRPCPQSLMNVQSDYLWSNEDYLKPVISDDALLMIDYEDLSLISQDISPHNNVSLFVGDPKADVSYENIIGQLQRSLQQREIEIENLRQDIKKMHGVFKRTLDTTTEVGSITPDYCDTSYARSYNKISIHYDMLSDRIRTYTYREAILAADIFRDKLVLDLGCGTGILSLFCLEAGALHVTAIDMSDVINEARDIVFENLGSQQKRIELIKGKLEDLNGPEHRFDIIVSEWMGYFLLYEGMIDSVIEARNRFLKPGGIMLPDRAAMFIVAVCDDTKYAEDVDFWNDVYGYKMRAMRRVMVSEACIDIVENNKVISKPALIREFDMSKCSVVDTTFSASFDLQLLQGDVCSHVTSIVGYFETYFNAESTEKSDLVLSTGPSTKPTHWKQTIFYLDQKLLLTHGQLYLSGRMSVEKLAQDKRGLNISLVLDGMARPQNFVMS